MTAATQSQPVEKSVATILPWGLAAVALVALVAVVMLRDPQTVAQSGSGANGQSAMGQAGPAPSIANMSPSERANRLYVRVMSYAEQGKVDSVATFAPMVLAAHEMLTTPTVDERYHFGRVAEVVGESTIATAQADTILAAHPQSLLGLLLAARAARMRNDAPSAAKFDQRLLNAVEQERATRNPDYESHQQEIDRALADAKRK